MPLVFSLFIGLGLIAIFISLTANLYVDQLVENTMVSIAYGEPLANYILEILAFLSGGTLLVIPIWFQMILVFSGFLLIWLGVTGILLWREGLSIRLVFSKEYWLKKQNTFTYDPHI